MTETQLLVDGALVPAATATISALDRGFRSGEGLFETLRVRDGRAFRLGAHLDRLVNTAGRLDIALDRRALGRGLATVVAANHHLGADLVVRITCSAGPVEVDRPFPAVAGDETAPTVVISVHPLAHRDLPDVEDADPRARGLLVDLHRELAWAKSTASLVALVAQRAAVEQGATDALLCDAQGAPLEAATANLFLVHDGHLVTPPVDAGILAGATRAAVLDVAHRCGVDPVVRPLTRDLLFHAEEAFLTSAVRGLRPLVSVDGQPIGTGDPGPVTRRLTAAYTALVAAEARPVDDPLSWSSGD
jgi:branched-subunit amino acid aminotransferase/4-amino-4-deoxychorismate lyase